MSFSSNVMFKRYDPYEKCDVILISISTMGHNGATFTSFQVRRGTTIHYMGVDFEKVKKAWEQQVEGLPENVVKFA